MTFFRDPFYTLFQGAAVRCYAMDDQAALRKVSGSSDSVSTVNSEEFVIVPQEADPSATNEEKPALKVTSHLFLSRTKTFL